MERDAFIARVKEVDFSGCPHCLLKTAMQIWIDLNQEELDDADLKSRATYKASAPLGHELGGAIVMASAFVKALSETLIEGGIDVKMHTAVTIDICNRFLECDEEFTAHGAKASEMLHECTGGA
jgi:hypothetical protein